MKILKRLLLLSLVSFSLSATTLQYNIIPSPQKFHSLEGSFTLTDTTHYSTDTLLSKNAITYLQEHLKHNAGYTLKQDYTDHNTLIYKKNMSLQDEAYVLNIKPDSVHIEASTQAGFFYATITLMQLLDSYIWNVKVNSTPMKKWPLPACTIQDVPRYQWRGMMLDTARNFFSKAYVKKFIDRMAQHKLNVFHWHLTDDEGWRIEIKKYPLLTQVGAKRGPGTKLPFSLYPAMRGPKDKMQEGYYSQEDIKEVVAYASARSINVLPEIDIPGHAKAAVMSYPELLQDPKDTSHYRSVQKVSKNTIDPSLESTYSFLDNVIQEVTSLFPYAYIHIGGDEVPKGAWKNSPSVKRLMQKEHLKNSSEVEGYFFTRMDKILAKYHRTLIGWQEIRRINSQLRDETIIMAWRGDGKGLKSVNKGENVIFSPSQFLYFDQQYVKLKNEYGHTWAGPTDTKEVYSYQPLHTKIKAKSRAYVNGVHACLWSETARNEKIADYLVWPRGLAFSEVAWGSNKTKSWRQFKESSLPLGLQRLRVQQINYRAKTP